MKKIIITLIFTLCIFGSATTLSATENQVIPVVENSEATPTKIENLSVAELELISSNIGQIKELVGDKVYYDESYKPILDEPISTIIEGHNITLYQRGNDVLMQFDNITTYYIDNTITVSYEPEINLFTTWNYQYTQYVTNKDWVEILGYTNQVVKGVNLRFPNEYLGAASLILSGVTVTAKIGSQFYATTYGTQKVYTDASCSSTTKRSTYWYSDSNRKYYLYNAALKQTRTDKIYYTGSRSCD